MCRAEATPWQRADHGLDAVGVVLAVQVGQRVVAEPRRVAPAARRCCQDVHVHCCAQQPEQGVELQPCI